MTDGNDICNGCIFNEDVYNECYKNNSDGSCNNRDVVRNLISDGWNNN